MLLKCFKLVIRVYKEDGIGSRVVKETIAERYSNFKEFALTVLTNSTDWRSWKHEEI